MTSDVLAADAGFEPAIRCRRPCVMPLDESAIRSTQSVHAWARRGEWLTWYNLSSVLFSWSRQQDSNLHICWFHESEERSKSASIANRSTLLSNGGIRKHRPVFLPGRCCFFNFGNQESTSQSLTNKPPPRTSSGLVRSFFSGGVRWCWGGEVIRLKGRAAARDPFSAYPRPFPYTRCTCV